jgi:hypothetical protein
MAVRNIVTDSAGRLYDIAITSGMATKENPGVKLDLLCGVDSGRALAGPLASTQAVLTCFLSVAGSDPVYPDYGTEFLSACRAGYIRTDSDVLTYFSLAASSCLEFFYRHDFFANVPADEIVTDITLDYYSLDVNESKLIMLVKVHFASGDVIDVIAPIKVI